MDDCLGAAPNITMTGKSVGDLLKAARVTWGWFYGDFAATSITGGVATCSAQYNNHYDPFQVPRLHHQSAPPAPQFRCHDWQARSSQSSVRSHGTLGGACQWEPSGRELRKAVTQTGHPSDSTPLAEQEFLVNTINQLQRSRFWRDMAIVIAYDDPDGWYDHVMPPIVNQSNDPANDALLGPAGLCGTPQPGAYLDRCGYGERLPFLVISPFAKRNYVDHSLNDTTSILRFIEDNWGLGRIGDQSFDASSGTILGMLDFDDRDDHHDDRRDRRLLLDPATGERIDW
jgi:phospholipase C